MQAVLHAALPIFCLIGTGYLSGRFGLISRVASEGLNRFAIYLALPALIFGAMSRVTPDGLRQAGYAAAVAGGVAVAYGAGFALARLRGRTVASASLEGLNASYGNAGFMGIPLCLLVFGPESLPAVVIAVLFTACVLFLLAVTLIEVDVQKGVGLGRTLARVALSLVRNPLLVAPLAGLAVALGGLPLPIPAARFVELLGTAASPAALVCIGLFLAHEPVVLDDVPAIAALVFLKLVVQPAATALLCFGVFDMPPLWAAIAVLLAGLPIGSGPFTVATLYRLDARVTSGAILLSHLVSVVTVSVLVAWLA